VAVLPKTVEGELMPKPVYLADLHPLEYEHPFDTRALDALQQTPGLDTLIRQFNKHAIERLITVQCIGSNLRITKENYPKLYQILARVCEIINLSSPPDFYLEKNAKINGFTVGVDNPIVVLATGMVDLLTDQELMYLIGHEIGHIKSRHTLYHQMAQFLPAIAGFIGEATLQLGKLLTYPLELALRRWSRMSEFTADRAGLLACQSLEVAGRVMMKLAGMPTRLFDDMKLEAFIEQAKSFEELDYDKLNKVAKLLSHMGSTHPWTVMRTAELLRWVENGEYDQVRQRNTRDLVFVLHDGSQTICRKCRYRLEGSEKFCPTCGSVLKSEIAPNMPQ
jgi:Zn-dependent protease with chaperone function